MSIGRKCDNCGEMVDGGPANVEVLDCIVVVDGEIRWEYEDLCPSCKARLDDFLSHKMNVGCIAGDASEPAPAIEVVEMAPTEESHATGQDGLGLADPEEPQSAYVPFSGMSEDDMADGVVKRWDLPKVEHGKEAAS